ncbi:ribosome-binding protein 1 isoform X1 [Drosophila gunungcola]|uniref:ribosome-binding protein 1 isoform X1 n=1 Tax=Drosophila gunungcola TaxID=103775 RepID=UPI0022E742AB|nr:ribosome-binding protein 1 isoform X1 [Drosophila gunungcola]XP_052846056.1 ribosome-binding protein 1 isoform X1 [Drosophila gunungcola]XP_052846133.1 ribosome-binding protein 1 isoform X1 [Drosophila gunungcola]XP_052846219.1 ribosome-binding protein 1 isoform X1 [Drosophila gunungcola]
MDFHILIVIGCVFSASLLSFLFINKIFRRKTFEEVVAEKRALNANLYKAAGGAATKKPKKKELKREKKQRQREQQRDVNNEPEPEEPEDFSDGQSEGQGSVADEEPGLSKQHVEFEPDAEILNEQRRPSSVAEKENQPSVAGKKGKKDKRNGAGNKTAGILVNKNETVVVKAPVNSEETPSLNNFETKVPKDVVELKKQEQKERKEDNNNKQQTQKKNGGGNVAKKEKPAAGETEAPVVAKQILKQQQNGSPKTQHNQANNKTKQQQQNKKQNQKETLTAKDLAQALDKLADHQNQTIGVNALMNVFSRAELNRSEIQILIDYLLNKQQDMPSSHSEWSDDICQKLKRQLEEKEKLLAEEQEASIGIQAKLRELRQEVNTERAQMHARIQAYNDKLQGKEQELSALNQELSSLNDKLALERQQFQTLLREKQANSQDLVQLQRLQQDLAHKEKCLAEMTAFVNAETQQKNEVIQQQAQQLQALELQRDELEARQNNSIFELEQRKQLEAENADLKQELCAVAQAQSELQRVHAAELQELRQQASALETSNQALSLQLTQAASSAVQATAAQSEQAQAQTEALAQKQQELSALRSQVGSLTDAQAQQQKQAAALQSQLQEAQQRAEQLHAKEQQLQQELQEQREKNNDVRMKNWKLIEALQNAEASTAKATAKTKTNTVQSVGQQHKELQQQQQKAVAANGGGSASSAKSEQQRIRDLYQRLYPDAVKAQSGNALQASFDQWLEQVLSTHVKQQQDVLRQKLEAEKPEKQSSSSHKSTQSNNSSSSNHNSTHNNISSNNSSSNSQSSSAAEQQELHKQILQLRECNDKLTQLVTKTTNTLMDLEERAREQDEHWRGIVDQKEQQILMLQQHASNGEQDI